MLSPSGADFSPSKDEIPSSQVGEHIRQTPFFTLERKCSAVKERKCNFERDGVGTDSNSVGRDELNKSLDVHHVLIRHLLVGTFCVGEMGFLLLHSSSL
jgi:hypothetical protein